MDGRMEDGKMHVLQRIEAIDKEARARKSEDRATVLEEIKKLADINRELRKRMLVKDGIGKADITLSEQYRRNFECILRAIELANGMKVEF